MEEEVFHSYVGVIRPWFFTLRGQARISSGIAGDTLRSSTLLDPDLINRATFISATTRASPGMEQAQDGRLLHCISLNPIQP